MEIKVSVRSDGIASTTVEGSMSAGVSKALVASSAVEVSATSDTAGVAGSSAAGGGDAAGAGLDFQKKLLVPREPLKARL